MTTGPLSGIRVLDLSRILAGPWATQLLADLGADVIKVERPGVGDDTRTWGPPFVTGTREATYYFAANRGKRSITIDFHKPEGRALIASLAAKSDVVMENFKTGDLERAGLDYKTLSATNPRLVYCSITGFGQTGPLRERPGYDLLMQGMGGLMSLTGEPDGEPMRAGVALIDVMTGLYASNAVMAALVERNVSGKGQYIDLALFDVALATLANQASAYLNTGKEAARGGNGHPSIVPYQVFATKDGHVIMAVGNDSQFASFAKAIGQPELKDRFPTNTGRVDQRDVLVPILEKALATKNTKDWVEIFEQANVPCGPVNGLATAFAEPQAAAREMVTRAPYANGGEIAMVNNPMRFSRSSSRATTAPPALGQHTDDVLKTVLNLSDDEIAKLKAANACR